MKYLKYKEDLIQSSVNYLVSESIYDIPEFLNALRVDCVEIEKRSDHLNLPISNLKCIWRICIYYNVICFYCENYNKGLLLSRVFDEQITDPLVVVDKLICKYSLNSVLEFGQILLKLRSILEEILSSNSFILNGLYSFVIESTSFVKMNESAAVRSLQALIEVVGEMNYEWMQKSVVFKKSGRFCLVLNVNLFRNLRMECRQLRLQDRVSIIECNRIQVNKKINQYPFENDLFECLKYNCNPNDASLLMDVIKNLAGRIVNLEEIKFQYLIVLESYERDEWAIPDYLNNIQKFVQFLFQSNLLGYVKKNKKFLQVIWAYELPALIHEVHYVPFGVDYVVQDRVLLMQEIFVNECSNA